MDRANNLKIWIEPFIAEKFDKIIITIFIVYSILVFITFTQTRVTGPIKFSFLSKKKEYLTPLGGHTFNIARTLLAALFLLILAILSWLFVTTPEEATYLSPATGNP